MQRLSGLLMNISFTIHDYRAVAEEFSREIPHREVFHLRELILSVEEIYSVLNNNNEKLLL